MLKKHILFISSYEIVYNPRLIKAADYLFNKGWEITVLTPVIGLVNKTTYNDFIKSRKWNIIEIDISKRSLKSKVKWAYASIYQRIHQFIFEKFNIETKGMQLLNKSLYAYSINQIPTVDVVYINLIDNLKFATQLKKNRNCSLLVFDSQEYFTGQYSVDKSFKNKWVNKIEKQYIKEADIICSTTNAMKDVIEHRYAIKDVIKLRNLPFTKSLQYSSVLDNSKPLKLIWHGLSINYNSRGVNIIITALSLVNQPIHLTLQGNINSTQKEIIRNEIERLNIRNKISIIEPAHPDCIVESLLKYDVGVIGELPLEDNQRLTSSNKLFEYIQAGLCVVTSNMPGIVETIDEYHVGEVYDAGNANELAEKLAFLCKNQELLNNYKAASQKAAEELIWQTDFDHVYIQLNTLLNNV
ncbi:MAG: glycosyltransferase [Flavobacteriales bacterium]|nr:glycosyltransferase [Flavobacteriales bacterium]MCB9499656.1 glycosyltransferase [Erysipelotrichaceae bacterium]